MPLDPSIPLQIRPAQFESPLNKMAQLLQIQGLQDQRDQSQQTMERQNKLRQAMLGLGANATDDQRIGTLKSLGEFDAADKIETGRLNRVKVESDADKAKMEAATKRVDLAGQVFNFVRTNPSLENAHAALDYLQSNGVYSPQQVQQYKALVQGDPSRIPALADMAFRGALDAKEQLAKIEKSNIGGSTIVQTVDPVTGQTSTVSSVANTQSPDNAATVGATIRGQNLVDQRSRDANDLTRKANANIYDAERGMIIDKGTGLARPAATMDGKPIAPKNQDKLTEDQGKATGWLIQANNAYKNMLGAIDPSMGGNPSAVKPGIGDAVAMVPGMSGAGNAMRSDDRQKFVQAASSLSEALLRAATGAGVNKDEAKQKVDELTPQWGDSAAVIKQKKDAIPLYIESLKVRAGPGAGKAQQISAGVSAADDNDPLGLRK